MIRGSTTLTIYTLRPILGSPLHLLSPPEDTFNFTITFNVPTGALTGSDYDDPIAIREDLKREKVIFRGNIK